MTAYFADAISNIAAVKAFAREKTELDKYQELIGEWRQVNMKEMKKVLLITGSFGMMMTIMNLCAFVAAIIATEYHVASIGIIYLIISYTLNVVSSLWEVSNTTRNYIRILGDAGPMISTLDEQIELEDTKNPEKSKIHDGHVKFDSIFFTHKDNSQALFDNFSLDVKAGERIGLVGKSGSGKTSLTRLLLRFSDVDAGNITIDSQNITDISQDDLHRAIAYVPQEPMLFHRTLRENIAYGKADASEDEIIKVAEQANAMDFINNLPKGLDTAVGERGVKLSGGQRQRIAIARAMLKDAPILVLDEATSALDSENEKLIQDALWELMKGRTSIVIAHRLSTIARLDRIIVLDEGKIIEQGSHAELLANNKIYAKLWAHQSGGFIKE
jgi:ATP-binding cassette subfamily B protein